MTDKSTRRAARLAADYVQPADVRAMQDMGPDVLAGVLAAVRTATRHDGQDVESLACMLAPRLFLAATDGKDTADRAARAARVARRQALAAVTSATLETYGDPADLADDTRTTASAYRPDPAAAYDYGTADVIDLALTDVARREGWTLATAVGLARQGGDLDAVRGIAATVTLPDLATVNATATAVAVAGPRMRHGHTTRAAVMGAGSLPAAPATTTRTPDTRPTTTGPAHPFRCGHPSCASTRPHPDTVTTTPGPVLATATHDDRTARRTLATVPQAFVVGTWQDGEAGRGIGWQAHPHRTSAQGGDRTPRQGTFPTTVTITRGGVTITRDLTAAEEEAMTGRAPIAQGPTHQGCAHTSCRTLAAQHARQADRDNATDGEGSTHAAQSAQAPYTPVPSGKVPVSPRKRSRGGSTGPTVPTTLARD